MIKRIYRCKECGREVVAQGVLQHLRTHANIPVGGSLDDVRDRLEVVSEVNIPRVLPTRRKKLPAKQALPASQLREVTTAIERHQTAKPVRVVRKIERHPTLEIVTDGERVGIVEWRDDLA